MNNTAKIVPLPTSQPAFFKATIHRVSDNRQKAQIKVQHGLDAEEWYQVPLNLKNNIEAGDEVLCSGDDCFFIISLLTKKEQLKIQTFSPEQELLFEYDPATNKSRVFIDQGDLEFVTRNGDIVFNAAENLVLGGNNINLHGTGRVNIGVIDDNGTQETSLGLDPRRIAITSPKLGLTSQLGELVLDEMHYTGKKCFAKISTVQLISKKIDCIARTISQKAENIFQKVKGLSQLRTGRKHEIIEETYHLKANQAILKSDNDFKVKAEKIHLG